MAMTGTRSVGGVLYRMMGAAVLDASTYEGIEADPRAGRQALAVVLLACLSAAVGASGIAGPNPIALMAWTAAALLAWVAWAMLILQIGAHFLPGRATVTSLGELVRTIGFAASPGVLLVFAAIVPAAAVFAVVGLWMLAAMTVAIRQALDYERTTRAALVVVSAVAVVGAVAFALGTAFARVVA